MGNLITVKPIIDDALQSGYRLIEENNLKAGIKYLEFAYENKEYKDEYLNYALVTSYYNLGEYDKAKKVLDNVKVNDIENTAIKKVVFQITKEIDKFEKEIQNKIELSIASLEKGKTQEEYLKYQCLVDILDDIELVGKHIKFNEKIKKIRKKLIVDVELLKKHLQEVDMEILDFILDYDLDDLLKNKEKENIEKKIKIIEENDFFELDIDNYLDSAKLFNNFYNTYKETNDILEIHKIYSISSEYPEHLLFLYQGIISNIFNELFNTGHLTLEFKNDIIYDIVNYYNDKLLSNFIIEKLDFEYETFSIDDFYKKAYDIQKHFKQITKDSKFLDDTSFFNKKYLKRNLNHYKEIKNDELVNKILIYIHYSSYELPENIKNSIISKIDLTDEHNQEKYEEIDKITLI